MISSRLGEKKKWGERGKCKKEAGGKKAGEENSLRRNGMLCGLFV